MIKQKERGNLVVVSGPSGAGKDTICNELVKINNKIWISISMTTREMRPLEKEGINYFYKTKEEFEKLIEEDEFLEYAIYNNNYYGTPKSKIEDYLNKGYDVILIIEIQGALKIKEKINDAVFIFILPPSMKELKKRLELRNTDEKSSILKRFQRAYQEINEVSKYNYVIINDEVEKAVEKVNACLLSERCRVDRIEEIKTGTIEEVMHEELVDKDFDNSDRKI